VRAAPREAAGPLTPAAVEIVAWVAQHRLLTTRQVRELRGPDASERWTLELLSELERRGALAHVLAKGRRKLWHVTERGAELALASDLLERPPKLLGAAEATGALQAHTLAVNDAAIAFLDAARQRPGDDFGPLSWRHEVAHPLTRGRGRRRRQLISDALLTYLVADGERLALEYRLLELDRASLSVDRLARKLARYAELARARDERGQPAWRAWYPALPAVIAVLAGADRAALERRRRTVLALCRTEPELAAAPELEVSLCLLEDLERRGPFAPIFLRPAEARSPVDWLGRARAASGRDAAVR
jgi:hypothetical protein